MTRWTGAVALAAAASVALPTGAQASEQTYAIGANAEQSIDINVCSSAVLPAGRRRQRHRPRFLAVRQRGQPGAHRHDETDLTFYTISNTGAGGGRCLPYRLAVKNYGNVYNNMVLSLTDQGVTSSGQTAIRAAKAGAATSRVVTQSVRAEAESSQTYTLSLCAPSVFLEVHGDGDTDLDFWVYDPSGREVHSDTDGTDITFATLSSGRSYGSCADFSLRIHNFGSVYNQVEIKLTEQ
jgi:hypothetical protein